MPEARKRLRRFRQPLILAVICACLQVISELQAGGTTRHITGLTGNRAYPP